MRKQIVITVVLAVFFAGLAHAQTDFFKLVETGTPQSVQAAIDMGADVNAQDRNHKTPLMYAAATSKNPEVITTLLKAGADIEARDLRPVGATSLLWAAYANPNPEVTRTLLKAGADIEARDLQMGRTALIWAVHDNSTEVITVLLKAGADTKVKDKAGYTAFDYAQNREKLKGTDALKELEEASK